MRRRRTAPPLVAAARRAGVRDERVIAAVRAVDRRQFVARGDRASVEADRPLPIGDEQTTSQPSLIARMVEALELRGDEHVLEVGTGLGYEAAILAQLAAEVDTIERYPALAAQARDNLAAAGVDNCRVHLGDGTQGLPERAPFDAVIVAAATEAVPAPLAAQLREGGRLVAPVGTAGHQEALVHEAGPDGLRSVRRLSAVRFVPLVADDPQ